jgi:beta-aspartyl-peptidase (threonine type)
MEKSPHVMMIGDGAGKVCSEQKIELVDPKYFWTQPRWDALQKILKKKSRKKLRVQSQESKGRSEAELPYNKFGTVGAVALDKDGNLAPEHRPAE